MINNEDIEEIKSRDFLENKNYYRKYDEIETKYIFGKRVRNPFLTIIMPVYDHPYNLMKRAIDSVLYQTCDYSYQVLIVDDFADRKIPSEFEKYVKSINDDRIIYYKNEKNLGVFANWNRGIELAESEWVTILHTDDFYKDNFLQTMKDIVIKNPKIDQLACNYKLINLLKDNHDISTEFAGNIGEAKIIKVSYLDYMYEMYTSVKGSFYKKKSLLEVGGFRSQGDGLGLDDYPLMLRYAYYFNTYLLDMVMYVDSWGYNDSLNTKHWYPELIENYYLWMYFAKKEKMLVKWILEEKAKMLLSIRAKEFSNGTSWVGVPVEIDFKELKDICNIKNFRVNKLYYKVISFLSKLVIKVKIRHRDTYFVNVVSQNRIEDLN